MLGSKYIGSLLTIIGMMIIKIKYVIYWYKKTKVNFMGLNHFIELILYLLSRILQFQYCKHWEAKSDKFASCPSSILHTIRKI